jgi:glycosyltransferase involved in cell wall biosynthesis
MMMLVEAMRIEACERIIVVPCFNEEHRLPADEFLRLAACPDLGVLFVDDGSADGTGALLRELRARRPADIEVLSLPRNSGKAETVRQGLRAALKQGARVVGFVDADLSTPVDEILRLLEMFDRTDAKVLLGSRVRLLGTSIQRSARRHYLGRVFATVASLTLGLPVYDTQCGAKLFRRHPTLEWALSRPFTSRWSFDVELIWRLLQGGKDGEGLGAEDFLEIPLRAWRDVPGSKLRGLDMLRAAVDLLALWVEPRRQPRR